MRTLFYLTIFLPVFALAEPALLRPHEVAVIYNRNIPESKELAEVYRNFRNIPQENLIGISTVKDETIDRPTYDRTIRGPLRAAFIEKNWWAMGQDSSGVRMPSQSKIRCLAIMRGIPLRIKRAELPLSAQEEKSRFGKNNEAAVDSELALLGVQTIPLGGPIPNQLFNKEIAATNSPYHHQLMVGRIDAATFLQCQQMILDAIETEKNGLWGRTYVDIANKGGGFAVGDKWMDQIAKASIANGLPTIVERTTDTFVTNYPMTDAAIYFGWYTFHRNGPFLNPAMKFKRGAVAVHLHSFSAAQLRSPVANWSAALIDRGAAATLGNTWEPYLQLSHHLNIFYDRLLKGYHLVEAATMSMNALSWQNIVIGDPLYRPFLANTSSVSDPSTDRSSKMLYLAHKKWTDNDERYQNITAAADKLKSGTIYEALGYKSLELKNYNSALKAFTKAETLFPEKPDRLRQLLNRVEVERRRKQPGKALKLLRAARKPFADIPESKSIEALLTILDPPPPPPAKKTK